MFNNVGLDVFIGLVFIFLLYSLLATILQEIIANQLSFRSKVLEKAILRMLEDGKSTSNSGVAGRFKSFFHLFGRPNLLKGKTVAPWFYAHPLIKYLGEDNFYSKPAYLSAENFSKVILDLLKGFGNISTNDTQVINDSINNGTIYKIPINVEADKGNPAIKAIIHNGESSIINSLNTVNINTDTALFLKSLWLESGGDIDKFKIKIEKWFDDTMERCTGWYKRYNRFVLFILGLVIAIIFNVDTIAIHRVLSKNDKAREQIVQMAISKQQQYGEIIKNMDEQKNNLTGIQLEVKKTADSVYRETYQLLSNDANSANTILGLGRPWKDSVNFYKDSLTDAFRVQKKALSEKLRLAHSIENSRDSVIKIIKALSISPRQTTFLQDSLSLSRIKDSLSSIIDSMNPGNIQAELDRKNFFESRCTIIHDKTEGKYFVYAPNQNGGWETLIGWLLTAWALCLGAPFWFDLLNKLISLRGTGTKINSGDKNNTSTAVNAAAPAQININTNSAEEAVG